MNRLRGKLTYANVISSLCLVLLLCGGTALAASRFGKETIGTRALKKEAVTPIKLSRKAKATMTGPRGATGAEGPRGATGPQGPMGPQGQFVDVVPSGQALVGTYAARDHATAANEELIAAISFGFRFSSAPTPHFVALGTTPPAQCPGNGLNPQATPGNLCVYETSMTNRVAPIIFDVNFDGNSSSPFGATVFTESLGAGVFGTSGSWAATAP
jgi:hypothetical protein